jgi:hypothetical protein
MPDDISALRIARRFLEKRQISVARDLHKEFFPEAEMSAKYVHYGFMGADRYKTLGIVMASLSANTRFSFEDLRKLLVLAEASGSIDDIQFCLKLFDVLFQRHVEGESGDPADSLDKAVQHALYVFRLDVVEALALRYPDMAAARRGGDLLERFRLLCSHCNVDWTTVVAASTCMMSGERIRIERPTAVLRLSGEIWRQLEKHHRPERPRPSDGLAFAEAAHGNGLDIALAPQFSNPGPAFFAPFAPRQDHPIVFVDHHKHSHSGPFIHFKKVLTNGYSVDGRGYSGWSEMASRPDRHDYERVDRDEARGYCDRLRADVFGPFSDASPDAALARPYGFVALQLSMDSVQALAFVDMLEMARASIAHFASLGLATVVKRHPKCDDVNVADFLAEIARREGVWVSTAPSAELVWRSSAVSTVNSTVGFEAVLAQKPLLAFGQAEYGSVAYNVRTLSDLERARDLQELVDRDRFDKFYCYYRTRYLLDSHAAVQTAVGRKMAEVLAER